MHIIQKGLNEVINFFNNQPWIAWVTSWVIGLKEALNKQVSCSSNISVKGCLQKKIFLKEHNIWAEHIS